MHFKAWMNSKIKRYSVVDFGLVKLSVAAFILMIAKLWTPLLSLDWYWYAVIFVLAVISPLSKIFRK